MADLKVYVGNREATMYVGNKLALAGDGIYNNIVPPTTSTTTTTTTAAIPGSPFVYTNPDSSTSYPGSGTTVYDLSGNDNNGTLTNGPTYTSGTPSYFTLDGTNDYVNYGDIGDTYGSFSAFTWVYLANNSGLKSIMSKWSDVSGQRSWMCLTNGSQFEAFFDRSGTFDDVRSFSSAFAFNATTWYLVGLTYDATTGECKGYINNTEKNSASFGSSGNLFNSTSPLQIGQQGEPSRPLNGRVGKFVLYKSVISSDDRTAIWNNTKANYGY